MYLKDCKFPPGEIVATPGALAELNECGVTIGQYLMRHVTGDWGTLTQHDWQENELSVMAGFRILSAYILPNGTKLWVITEADRSSTCFLLPDEY